MIYKKLLSLRPQNAGVAELVDAPDLGSGSARSKGSSPFIRTDLEQNNRYII